MATQTHTVQNDKTALDVDERTTQGLVINQETPRLHVPSVLVTIPRILKATVSIDI
jgi:hypothetical protein